MKLSVKLTAIACGEAYYEHALKHAQIHSLCNNLDDQALLSRYLTGSASGTDHCALMDIAIKLNKFGV